METKSTQHPPEWDLATDEEKNGLEFPKGVVFEKGTKSSNAKDLETTTGEGTSEGLLPGKDSQFTGSRKTSVNVTSSDEDVQDVRPGPDVPCICSQRWILAYMGFTAMAFTYSLRVNMSVAVVCMVKSDQHEEDNDTMCPVKISTSAQAAEFSWNKDVQSMILAAFFWGYIITQIPGGWMASRFGGKRVLAGGMLLAAVITILIPVAARTNKYIVVFLRVMLGISSGVLFSSMHSIWGLWAPPVERSILMAITYSGPYMGNIITLNLSSYLCENGFDHGWGSIFYIIGGATIVFLILWYILIYDSPKYHPRIKEAELLFLLNAMGASFSGNQVSYIPWIDIFKSTPVWAIIVAHICFNWSNYTLLTVLPLYMKEVLKFNIKKNGLMSSIPYFGQVLSYFAVGYIADYLRSRGSLSTRLARIVLQDISFLGTAGFMIAVAFVNCNNPQYAVAFLFFSAVLMGLSGAGFMINHVDIAPRYAGILFGITNFFSTLSGILAPLIAGLLTPNKSQEEWQNVFFLCAGTSVFGAFIYTIFAKGDLQVWALEEDELMDLEAAKRRATRLTRKHTQFEFCNT